MKTLTVPALHTLFPRLAPQLELASSEIHFDANQFDHAAILEDIFGQIFSTLIDRDKAILNCRFGLLNDQLYIRFKSNLFKTKYTDYCGIINFPVNINESEIKLSGAVTTRIRLETSIHIDDFDFYDLANLKQPDYMDFSTFLGKELDLEKFVESLLSVLTPSLFSVLTKLQLCRLKELE